MLQMALWALNMRGPSWFPPELGLVPKEWEEEQWLVRTYWIMWDLSPTSMGWNKGWRKNCWGGDTAPAWSSRGCRRISAPQGTSTSQWPVPVCHCSGVVTSAAPAQQECPHCQHRLFPLSAPLSPSPRALLPPRHLFRLLQDPPRPLSVSKRKEKLSTLTPSNKRMK